MEAINLSLYVLCRRKRGGGGSREEKMTCASVVAKLAKKTSEPISGFLPEGADGSTDL